MRSLIFCFSFFTKLWRLSLSAMSAGHLIIYFWRCISVVSFLLFPLSVSESFIIAGFNWRPLSGDDEKKIIPWTKLVVGLMVFNCIQEEDRLNQDIENYGFGYVTHYPFPSKISYAPCPQFLFVHIYLFVPQKYG